MRGRPRKTWMEVIENDSRSLNANRMDAQNRTLWRKTIRGGKRTWVIFRGHLDGHTSKICYDMSMPLNNDEDEDDDDLLW